MYMCVNWATQRAVCLTTKNVCAASGMVVHFDHFSGLRAAVTYILFIRPRWPG